MKIVIDMNLSPSWVPVLERHGWSAVHWADVGDPRAGDRVIMDWAVDHEHIVFTHDLDFGTMLALSHEGNPSVLQIRGQDVLPIHLGTNGFGRSRSTRDRSVLGCLGRGRRGEEPCTSPPDMRRGLDGN